MSLSIRRMHVLGLAFLLLASLDACAPPPASSTPPAGDITKRLEVLSGWTGGSEAAGLFRLYDVFKAAHPGVEISNATAGGGDGSNAKAIVKVRLTGGDPPDSFQSLMGHDLIDAWVTSGFMENLDDLYRAEGLDKAFPQGMLDMVSADGHYWSVPLNVRRVNLLWYNKKIFADNDLRPPKTWQDFFVVAEKLNAKGIIPLAVGNNLRWASTNLFETVLIGTMGADKYNGLWSGKTDWSGSEVKLALETFKKIMPYVNTNYPSLSLEQANDLVLSGEAAMMVAIDLVNGDNLEKKKADLIGWAPAPGNEGVFDAMSNGFGLPTNVDNRLNALEWLKLVGSKAGQEAFNPTNGSICARTDCDTKLFDPYLQSAMRDWTASTIVPSVAHGAAASDTWVTSLNNILTTFMSKQDIPTAQLGLQTACENARICR